MSRWWSWQVVGDPDLRGHRYGGDWAEVADEVSTELRLMVGLAVPVSLVAVPCAEKGRSDEQGAC